MTDTYTYTARNVDNPDLVVTLTLTDHHLRFSFTEVLEKVGQIARSDDRLDVVRQQVTSQAAVGAMKSIERISGPNHVADVSVRFDGERLKLICWQRLAGLRLAPLWLNLGRVDNPGAAEAFVAELDRRQTEASSAGKFFGIFDYWLGWAGLLAAAALLLRWPRTQQRVS